MASTETPRQPIALAILFILTGVIGVWAAFQLVLERFILVADPGATLGCDVSEFVACSDVIQSPQGSVFGFPNPLIGVACFVAPVAVGLGILAGARFAAWFWWLFNVGLLGAIVFIHWLMIQAVYVIGVLCPYCMLVWLVTIPLFWYGTVFNLSRHLPGAAARRLFRLVYPFTWIIVLINYLIIALLIQNNFPLLLSSLLRG